MRVVTGCMGFFTDKINDYGIADDVLFFKFSETLQEILENQDTYSRNDVKKVLALQKTYQSKGRNNICVSKDQV